MYGPVPPVSETLTALHGGASAVVLSVSWIGAEGGARARQEVSAEAVRSLRDHHVIRVNQSAPPTVIRSEVPPLRPFASVMSRKAFVPAGKVGTQDQVLS